MSDATADWDNQHAFLAVLREGSLSGAARVLGVAQPTVRRRIEALERSLNLGLFTRSAASLVPTASALSLQTHVEAMEAAAESFSRAATSDAFSAVGRVRVASSELIGVEIVGPILPSLRARHPGLSIELSLSSRIEALSRQEADIAIRTLRPVESTVVVKRIGKIDVGLYASGAYLEEFGVPRSMAELKKHAFVGPDRNGKDLMTLRENGLDLPVACFALRTDHHLAQLGAIRQGVGIGACHRGIAERSGLHPVLENVFGFSHGLWLAMPAGLRHSFRVRATFDHLAANLQRNL
jgi:DNA-binding transcriptional LysR family regulator